MIKNIIITFFVLIFFVTLTHGNTYVKKADLPAYSISADIISTEDGDIPVIQAGDGDIPVIAQSPGEIVGITFHDQQHNTTLGHNIAVDDGGGVNIAWMWAADDQINPRRVKYRYRNSDGTWGTLSNVDPGPRGGYSVMDLKMDNTGVAFYHLTDQAGDTETQVATDLIPGFGSFIPVYVDNNQFPLEDINWPQGAVGYGNIAYVMAANNNADPIQGTVYYSHSNSDDYPTDLFQDWELLEDTRQRRRLLSFTIDASKTSPKVVRAFLLGVNDDDNDEGSALFQTRDDVYVQFSTDSGLTWGDLTQVTFYNSEDGDYLVEADYMPEDDYTYYWEASHTVEAHIDGNDTAHLVWSQLLHPVRNDTVWGGLPIGGIFHWDDLSEEISVVYDDWTDNPKELWDIPDSDAWIGNSLSSRLGAFKTTVCAPTITHDEDNNLYVVFNKFFYDDYCAMIPDYQWQIYTNGKMFNGDIMAIGSTDNGATWWSAAGQGEAINLTDTHTPDCQPGECDDDRYPTVAKQVVNGDLHIFYVHDKSPGRYIGPTFNQNEGEGTENPIMYLSVPASEIFTGDAVEDDSDLEATEQSTFLRQNRPNPFNTKTTIRFNLNQSSKVELAIYNEVGQLVKTLVQEHRLTGEHEVVWDGSDDKGEFVSTGLYFYRLSTDKIAETKRMIMIR